jgi:sec-independent protein translocase protein TatA
MGFGNFGMGELLMVLVIVLVLFGAKRVPEIGASIGKGIREFKRNISDVDKHLREPEQDHRIGDRTSVDRLPADRAGAAPGAPADEARPEPKRLMN